jgi:MoxR-like ATPase
MFQSVDQVIAGFGAQNYICNKNLATVVYLGICLQKPILVEGPAGVGKTELGKVLAGSLGLELIRLQCYEGLDEAKALYEWEYAKQLLYTQILKEKIGDVLQEAKLCTRRWTVLPARTVFSFLIGFCCRGRCCGRFYPINAAFY